MQLRRLHDETTNVSISTLSFVLFEMCKFIHVSLLSNNNYDEKLRTATITVYHLNLPNGYDGHSISKLPRRLALYFHCTSMSYIEIYTHWDIQLCAYFKPSLRNSSALPLNSSASFLCGLLVASTAAWCARGAAARSSLLTNPPLNACRSSLIERSYPCVAAMTQCFTALSKLWLFHS